MDSLPIPVLTGCAVVGLESEYVFRITVANSSALVIRKQACVGLGTHGVENLVGPVGSEHDSVAAYDGNEILQGSRIISDAVIVDMTEIISRLLLHLTPLGEFYFVTFLEASYQVG